MFEPLSRESLGAPDAFEQRVLARWEREDLLHVIAAARAEADAFVFYEGPPTANGRPGIHHVLSRTLKDSVCRYQTMRGKRIERKAGWDTHGLPVELEVEKAARHQRQARDRGLRHRARSTSKCRGSVFTYKEEWEQALEADRLPARLRPARTSPSTSRLRRVGLVPAVALRRRRTCSYQGYKVLPWCGRCGTGLSSHEVGQGYQDIDDPSVWVGFPLVAMVRCARCPRRSPAPALVAWTTTPWTLPSNMASGGQSGLHAMRWSSPTDTEVDPAPRAPRRRASSARAAGSKLADLRSRRPRVELSYDAVARPRRLRGPVGLARRGGALLARRARRSTTSATRTAPAWSTSRRTAPTTSASLRSDGPAADRSVRRRTTRAPCSPTLSACRARNLLPRRQQSRSRTTLKERGRMLKIDAVSPQLPALLALRHAADLLPGAGLVSAHHRVQGRR